MTSVFFPIAQECLLLRGRQGSALLGDYPSVRPFPTSNIYSSNCPLLHTLTPPVPAERGKSLRQDSKPLCLPSTTSRLNSVDVSSRVSWILKRTCSALDASVKIRFLRNDPVETIRAATATFKRLQCTCLPILSLPIGSDVSLHHILARHGSRCRGILAASTLHVCHGRGHGDVDNSRPREIVSRSFQL